MGEIECPKCGCKNFEFGEPEYPSGNMEREVDCNNCSWDGVQVWSDGEFKFR